MVKKPMIWNGQYVDEMSRDELVKAMEDMAAHYETKLSKLRKSLSGIVEKRIEK